MTHRRGRDSNGFKRNPDELEETICGRWPVKEALGSGPVSKVYLANGTHGDNIKDILSLAKKKKVPFYWIERRRMDQMTDGNHQGIVAKVSPIQFASYKEMLRAVGKKQKAGTALLFLDGIQDPQNLGTILRSAVFFGVQGVVIPKWRASSLSGVVLRSSAGAAGLIPVARVSNLVTALEEAKKAGVWLVGADMKGESIYKCQVPHPLGLIMGAEGPGLHELVRKKCDFLVSIPGDGFRQGINSLNVGVACGVLLSHLSKA